MTSTVEKRAAKPEELVVARAALAAERRRVAALSLFARRMAHDMSNFVTVVRTYSELLLADLPPEGSTHADVQEIHRAADAMIEYMHRIVRFARLVGTGPGALQLDESVGDAVRNCPFSARVRTQLTADTTVRVDASWLADAVRELITNACEAAPEQSLVHVRTWRENVTEPVIDGGLPIEAGLWTVLEIADEGPGFSEDVLDDALDPFVTTKHAVRGAGFGLALARSAAWGAGGQLSVESGKPSTPGTRVRMWLPVVTETTAR